ncbi:hypothetical protein BUALT_Bualt01G0010100 [Buddleja alternifolia]|uniref:Kri1-like C-terminal domain-containing protein n=1 Tax=Buddleja alternifolia TaxID=168488 RepID=A0AAV6YE78_9LAMI|nr:hypothetical protein BUALT_Bualt01G0010100 [Buddleja alternifolia]
MGRLELFGDDGDSPNGDVSKIEINREFAKRYEHNKKREELQRYEELKKKGRVDDSDSGSSSEEEDELIKPSKKTDFEFFDALIKIKNQDPILKNKDSKLFISDSENENESGSESEKREYENNNKKKIKPMYLKDVVSKQLIEDGPEFDDEEMENGGDEEMKNRVKSYSEEQEEFRREFLEAVEEEEEENDEEGDFLKVKNGGSKEGEEEEEDEDEIGEKLDDYFGEDEKLDKDTMFLKDYFRKRRWIDDGRSKNIEDGDVEFSEDEEEIEKQENYEKGYNFRFEENAGDRVTGHSRKVEGSVRKKENARKSQRERKEERMAQAQFEQKEELKRLKNLKKKEINEKLEKIKEAAGVGKNGSVFLDEDDLEEEFDPDEYDRKMNEAFGDWYYKAEDVDPGFGSDDDEDGDGLEKPDFDKEDDLLGLSKGWDEVKGPSDGFKSARERILRKNANDGDKNDSGEDGDENDSGEDGDENDSGEDEDEDENDSGEDGDRNDCGEDGDNKPKVGKRKRKHKPSEVEKAIREELMEEYYKLDYEDTIGDLKTRFKYKPVKAKRYGLSPEEVLMMDDKDLNQYVSLKKLAPYEEKEWKVPRIKTIQLKQKTKEHINGEKSVSVNKGKKKRRHDDKATTEVASGVENDEMSGLSRGSKRRRRQAELRLPHSRLMAYGKIPSKSKSKKQ